MDLTKQIDITRVNDTAKKYSATIRTLDMLDASEMLGHFTPVSGVQDSIVLTHLIPGERNSRGYDGNFSPTKQIAIFKPRTLKVYPIVYELKEEPEKLRRSFLATVHGAVDNIDEAFYRWLIEWCISKASEELYEVLTTAKRDDATAPDDILNTFDGLEQLIVAAIAAGDISAAEKNYYDPGTVYTASNIGDLLLEQWRSLPTTFKKKGGKMLISENMGEMYDDWYKANHDKPPMLDTAGQTALEGTNGRCVIVRQSNIENQRVTIFRDGIISYGFDKASDMKSLKAFQSGNPYLFTATMKFVFGLQVASFHKSLFSTNKLYETSGSGSASASASASV